MSRTLQRALPADGWLCTIAMIRWLLPASSTCGWPGRGFSYPPLFAPESQGNDIAGNLTLAHEKSVDVVRVGSRSQML